MIIVPLGLFVFGIFGIIGNKDLDWPIGWSIAATVAGGIIIVPWFCQFLSLIRLRFNPFYRAAVWLDTPSKREVAERKSKREARRAAESEAYHQKKLAERREKEKLRRAARNTEEPERFQ